ncbi:hypothetical protein EUTSA_v10019543mg [Eutrema salsugineum]|uniref:Gamma-glutamyltransferase n=1 Tax=Eutrema salsugineum TaxID=72664 RepID=V4KEJ5_EUTSA|nr:hypothetical protein EUTSA_v10019543mg [Eutrema salsugineum]
MQMNSTRDYILADKCLSELYVLRQIAEHGTKAFYNGTVGVNLVRDIQFKVKKPLSVDILGYRLLGMPLPSSGGAAMILVLNILSGYGIPAVVSGPLGVHRLVEAMKHAFAVRMNLGDPDFVDVTKDDKVKAVVGASGGSYIIAGTTEVFLNHFFLKMDPLSSVLAPRIYHQLIPNIVSYENWTTVFSGHFEIPKETRVVLEKKGHVLAPITGGTIAQFIVQESGANSSGMSELVAVSDPRKGGFPSGY